ncbi:ring-1,2-phenylacetyl-CoA epoxidase subunit PaaD [Epilithonimonas hungarica]|uniref:Ring-1,2-phenylacetyl-CoA epoxidase subunit PaaD n=2 Tax=Epilithonimonas hungarica TaxID=454006 RepID=A0A1G7NY13_9FLAO|nr:ring-1,2-phenylacetyl-CoA epoxidase subunit PaaD [Epilithonimonas hungarica]
MLIASGETRCKNDQNEESPEGATQLLAFVIKMTITENDIWQILKEVPDPEVPVLNLLDLGIIRDVRFNDDEIEVVVTPTYSGCPATSMINMSIKLKLIEKGFNNIKITNQLSPAWTTDWMTEEGKQKLKAYGIAPPVYSKNSDELFSKTDEVECPLCSSKHTHLVSQFGSTACKALYQCDDCKEPFDYFKCH